MNTLNYLKSFFKDKDVASVTPTSGFCVRRVCEPIDFSKDLTIVEYGAGAGVFSRFLMKNMSNHSHLYLFETNELLFEELKKLDEERVSLYKRSVAFARELLPDEIIGETDIIISGIPFSFLDENTKDSILQQSNQLLKEGGQFLAYQTSGHLKESLQTTFKNVSTEWEWRNIPPMTIYEAIK